MAVSVNDHLGRVDAIVAAFAGIVSLPLGVGGRGEGVTPADVIPVVDVERQADDILLADQLAHEGVGSRAG